jgi:hypothetical protein
VGNLSDLSPISADAVLSNNGQVNYTNVPVSSQASVRRRQILRNTAGQQTLYYVDIDTTDIGSTSLTSTRTDPDLTTQEFQALFDEKGNDLANLYGVPPDWKPFLCYHQNRMHFFGFTVYREGCVIVEFGSTHVVGIGTEWKHTFPGRFFYGKGGTVALEIASVDVDNQTLELVSAWLDDSDPYLAYSIRPAPAEEDLLYWSEPSLPESVPATNSLEIPRANGGDGTGLFSMSSFMYLMRERTLQRLTAQVDPGTDGFIFLAANRGCVNQRCVVVNGDVAWLLDDQGIYQFSGGKVDEISQGIQAIFRGSSLHYQLNWEASRYWHASFDHNNNTVRFFVTLSGDYLPRHALCFQTVLQRWWVEHYPVPIGSSTSGRTAPDPGGWRVGGRNVFFMGSRASKVFRLETGTSLDQADPATGTISGDVTSAGPLTLTCKNSAFGAATVGSRIYITSGPGEGQDRLIVSYDNNVLTVDVPWLVLPTSLSKFVIGGISWLWRSGSLDYRDSETRVVRQFKLTWEPVQRRDEALARRYDDFNKVPVKNIRNYTAAQRQGIAAVAGTVNNRIDLTKTEGVVDLNFHGHREMSTDAPRSITLELSGISSETLTIRGVEVAGIEGPRGGNG